MSCSTGTVSMIRSKLDRASHRRRVGGDEHPIGAERERVGPLFFVRLITVTSAPSPPASLTAMWPSPPRPMTPTLDSGPTFQVLRGEYVVMPAQSRGAVAGEIEPFRHAEHELLARDEVLRIAAVGRLAGEAILAVVGLRVALAAELLLALAALVAGLAAVDHAADRDRVADLVTLDLRPTAVTRPTISWPGTIGYSLKPQSLRA